MVKVQSWLPRLCCVNRRSRATYLRLNSYTRLPVAWLNRASSVHASTSRFTTVAEGNECAPCLVGLDPALDSRTSAAVATLISHDPLESPVLKRVWHR